MINYAKLRDKMNKHDYSLSKFAEIIDMAVAMHSSKFLPSFPALKFCTDDDRQSAREDAFLEVQDMPWQQIVSIAEDMGVVVELSMDSKKEEKNDLNEGIWRTNNG